MQNVKHQPPGQGTGLGQANLHFLRQTEGQAGAAARQGLCPFVVHPEIIRQRGCRDDPARATVSHSNKQPEPRHPRNARGEDFPHFIGHECREVTINCIALRQLGATFGGGDVFGGLLKARRFLLAQPAGAEVKPANQGAVDQQIGVAADRAGEMGVAGQTQSKMADIFRCVGGLRLAAQHDFVDDRRVFRAGDHLQDMIQVARMDLVAGRQGDVELAQEVAQVLQFFFRWWRVHAIHAGLAAAFQLLRGADIGQYHEFLDQPVAVQARPGFNGSHFSLVVQFHLAFR